MELKVCEAISWHQPYSQTEEPSLFRSAHLLHHTKYNDPCPRSVVEAMFCGLPVIYSATGSVPELVGENTGAGSPGPEDYNHDHTHELEK